MHFCAMGKFQQNARDRSHHSSIRHLRGLDDIAQSAVRPVAASSRTRKVALATTMSIFPVKHETK